MLTGTRSNLRSPIRANSALQALLRVAVCASPLISSLAAEPAQKQESPWDWSATLNAGAGYKDNILLSDFNQESSIFTFTSADVFLLRVPIDGWEFAGILNGEDRRYWQSSSVDKEQLFLTSLDVKKAFAERWKGGLNLQYFYNDQVFDASVIEGLPFRVQAKLHRFLGAPTLQLELPEKRRIEAAFTIIRQNFELPLDDSWEIGPKLLFGQKYGYGSDLTFTAQWKSRTYDTRVAPGTADASLQFTLPEIELGVRHVWDAEKHWRSRARAGLEWNTDNGSGFYDYRKWRISNELSFTQEKFEAMLQAKFLHYEYTVQTAPNGRARRRTELLFGGRVREKVLKHLAVFVEAEHEWVLATDISDRYHATTVWGGVEWEIK